MPPNPATAKQQSPWGLTSKGKKSTKEGPFQKRGSEYERRRDSNGPGASSTYTEVWNNAKDGQKINAENSPSPKKNNSSSKGGITSARRFLWGEDEEEDVIAQMGQSPSAPPKPRSSLFGVDPRRSLNGQAINLMAPPVRSDRDHTPPPASAFRFFGTSTTTSGNNNIMRSEYGDAADSGEAEEYIDRKPRTRHYTCSRVMRVCLSPLIALGIILSIILVTRQMILDNEDMIQTKTINAARFADIRTKVGGLTNETVLDTLGSPQFNALQWISYQDPAKLGVNDTHLVQRYVLAVFFFSTSGKVHKEERPMANWKSQDHWMTGRSICRWYGIRCVGDNGKDDEHIGEVLSLNLTNNAVQGTLPVELQSISLLESVDLSQNSIEGRLPIQIAKFPALRDLFLRANQLEGRIPTELGSMTLLRALHLGKNQFTGRIPTQLRQATRLRALGLDTNQLTGAIPDFASLSSLSKWV
jgi:hypothetical protein